MVCVHAWLKQDILVSRPVLGPVSWLVPGRIWHLCVVSGFDIGYYHYRYH